MAAAHDAGGVIVVHKVDRLTRSLADFAKLVELFDKHGVSFVSVTQSFNTTTSMGRYAGPSTLSVMTPSLAQCASYDRAIRRSRCRRCSALSRRKAW